VLQPWLAPLLLAAPGPRPPAPPQPPPRHAPRGQAQAGRPRAPAQRAALLTILLPGLGGDLPALQQRSPLDTRYYKLDTRY
jgi:hypothetical protein